MRGRMGGSPRDASATAYFLINGASTVDRKISRVNREQNANASRLFVRRAATPRVINRL